MRFNELLHPEIIYDLRGDKDTRVLYKEALSLIETHGSEMCLRRDKITIPLLFQWSREIVFAEHLFVCKKFIQSKGKIYRIGADIAKQFTKIKTDIPLDILPKSFWGYISFKDKIIFENKTNWYSGAYVSIASEKIHICYFIQPGNSIGHLILALATDTHKSLDSSSFQTLDRNNKILTYDSPATQNRILGHRAIINSLVYIFSSEPVLELATPSHLRNISNKEILRRNEIVSDCTLPVTFVYRNFHGRRYNVDKTLVSSHMRWQRCGPQNSKAKLIWIDEHERTYDKTTA